MEDFRIIYRILKILQRSMDLEEIDKDSISFEALKISEPRWCRIMAMLIHEGYITGAETWNKKTPVSQSILGCKTSAFAYLNTNTLIQRSQGDGILCFIAGY